MVSRLRPFFPYDTPMLILRSSNYFCCAHNALTLRIRSFRYNVPSAKNGHSSLLHTHTHTFIHKVHSIRSHSCVGSFIFKLIKRNLLNRSKGIERGGRGKREREGKNHGHIKIVKDLSRPPPIFLPSDTLHAWQFFFVHTHFECVCG